MKYSQKDEIVSAYIVKHEAWVVFFETSAIMIQGVTKKNRVLANMDIIQFLVIFQMGLTRVQVGLEMK